MNAISQMPAAEGRGAPRSNMFISALLQGAGFATPVTVRNMSSTGALVEAPTVPREDTQAKLVRGSLEVACVVAWAAEGRCGLRYASLASVRDWLAPPANRGQQRVDELVALLKLGAFRNPESPSSEAESPVGTQPVRLGTDLHRAVRLMESLGENLAGDAQVLEHHSATLQKLDIAVQAVAAVADALLGAADERAIAERLENLRAGCAQAL